MALIEIQAIRHNVTCHVMGGEWWHASCNCGWSSETVGSKAVAERLGKRHMIGLVGQPAANVVIVLATGRTLVRDHP